MPMAAVSDRVWTVGELLNWTRGFFEERGVEEPRLTAEMLLSHALACRRIDLYMRFDGAVGLDERARLRDLVRRRAEHVPVQYLTRAAQFLTLVLYVDERVMIPRSETEVVVEAFEARVPPGPALVADVGTGSGAIAVAVARRRPAVRVIATDLSAEALEVAARNVREHGVAERVELVHGDLLAPLAGREETPSAILANLPYVSEADLKAAEPEVREHEPRLALDGGPDGLRVIRRLIERAPGHLAAGGWLILEVGAGQADPVARELARQGLWSRVDRVRDYAGHERVICALRNDRPSQAAASAKEG